MVHSNKLKDLYQQLVVDIEFGNIQTREYTNKKYNIKPPLKKKIRFIYSEKILKQNN
jgi:hypothetical protein